MGHTQTAVMHRALLLSFSSFDTFMYTGTLFIPCLTHMSLRVHSLFLAHTSVYILFRRHTFILKIEYHLHFFLNIMFDLK